MKHLLSNQTARLGLPIILVLILLFPLFQTASPSFQTGHPWKVELLSTLFLFVAITFAYLKLSSHRKLSEIINKKTQTFLILFLSFVILSGISAFWANSLSSVAHHTFLWLNYLLFFMLISFYLKTHKSYSLPISLFILISVILFANCFIEYLLVTDFTLMEGIIRIRYAKFAELLLVFSPLLWGLSHIARNKKHIALYLIAGCFGWLTVMFSLSKGALISGIICFSFLFIGTICFSKKHFRKRAIYLAIFWLVLTFGTQFFVSYVSNVPATTDYIAGNTEKKRTTSNMRLFTWKVALQMISDNPIVGVGADNFGVNINNTRKRYAKLKPNDTANTTAEYYLIERTHNEFLQIFAELGVIGFLIFLSIIGFLLKWIIQAFIVNKYKFSPLLFGSLAGIIAFLVSSQFSSFSFRAAQNGIMFFFVLAITLNELSKLKRIKVNKSKNLPSLKLIRPAFASVLLLILLGLITYSTQGLSNYYLMLAQAEKDIVLAEKHLEKALFFNKENATVYLTFGLQSYSNKQYKKAVSYFTKAKNKELGTTLVFYYLAKSQMLSGNLIGAEQTLAEAIEIYPHSIYARSHYAYILEQNNKYNKADKQNEYALKLNKKEAKSWKIIFSDSVLAATLEARKSDDLIEPGKLSDEMVVMSIHSDENSTLTKKTKVSKK